MDFLYCSDENYAPYLGISILSLLEHNRAAARIRILVVSDGIGAENLARLTRTVESFGEGRELVLVDGAETVKHLQALQATAYRGGHAANLRLFFSDYIPSDVERMLYLDCDTLVCDDLTELFATDLGGAPAAWVQDSLTEDYKQALGFGAEEPYFNSGVLLVDVPRWRADRCHEELLEIMQKPEYRGACPDQDLLNFLLRGRAAVLAPRYNFQTTHQLCADRIWFACNAGKGYYTAEELDAARKSPAILHTYRFLGQFPWHHGNLHPAKGLFWSYVRRSEWADLREVRKKGAFFAAERMVYRLMPKRLFWRVFMGAQARMFRNRLAEIRGTKESAQ